MKNRIRKLNRLAHTLRYLKPVQIVYQIRYRCYSPGSLHLTEEKTPEKRPLDFYPAEAIAGQIQREGDQYRVTYLNLSETFDKQINWNYSGFGKLWNYHLQYADFLKQMDLSVHLKTELITDLYQNLVSGKLPPEPYPASLRIMNVIRFLSTDSSPIENRKDLIRYLSSELEYLSKRPEYHLLGNHLLENAFALLMGGIFLSDPVLVQQAEKILFRELDEQILDDGAHFERSPMYHKIILFRVLEAIQYLPDDSETTRFLTNKAEKMVEWLHLISFRDGTLPHFNDSTEGIAPETTVLKQMADVNHVVASDNLKLNECGYRKLISEPFELIADLEGIKPDYQPGHAHADSLSFQLHIQGKPVFTDPGLTTYEICERRDLERSTAMHNTVTVDGANTADVWGGFRVGYRPDVTIEDEGANRFSALLKSVKPLKFTHQRVFLIQDSQLYIDDLLDTDKIGVARFYLHPDTELSTISDTSVMINQNIQMKFEGAVQIAGSNYNYSTGFNRSVEAKSLELHFQKKLKTIIRID